MPRGEGCKKSVIMTEHILRIFLKMGEIIRTIFFPGQKNHKTLFIRNLISQIIRTIKSQTHHSSEYPIAFAAQPKRGPISISWSKFRTKNHLMRGFAKNLGHRVITLHAGKSQINFSVGMIIIVVLLYHWDGRKNNILWLLTDRSIMINCKLWHLLNPFFLGWYFVWNFKCIWWNCNLYFVVHVFASQLSSSNLGFKISQKKDKDEVYRKIDGLNFIK